MKKLAVYIHGKGGCAAEAAHYKPLFQGYGVIGFDYKAQTPWEAKEEFPAFIDPLSEQSESMILIANSIGAYFSIHAWTGRKIDRAFLISPIVDMEQLILNMLLWANTTEDELREKQEIPTTFGETLSWAYLCYARAHPIHWDVPTEILYGEQDTMTSYESICDFSHQIGAKLTVMKGGEHWFHTDEQMAFLDAWIRRSL